MIHLNIKKYGMLLMACLLFFSAQSINAAECGVVQDSVLYISAGVRTIPAYAFKDRTDFKKVSFKNAESIEKIGDYSFLGCAALEEIQIPNSVKEIGEGAFRECASLRSAEIGNGVARLSRYLFAWCEALQSVKMPSRLKDISSHAFIYCRSLQSIEIPSTVTHIGSNAFTLCESLKRVKMPASIAELESYAFAGCSSLESVELPANDKLLGELIFTGCSSLQEIAIYSKNPPKFDCNSTLFDPSETEMYKQCRLKTLKSSEDAYRRAPGWSLFF